MEPSHEIEAKFKITVERAAKLEDILRSYLAYSRFETNEFYDTKKRKLDSRDEVLRIRTTRDNLKGNESIITFKGKPIKSKFKCRPEYETNVDDVDSFRLILKSLGYSKYFLFQKRRNSYIFNGCQVEIDLLPELGYFCEIEGNNEDIITNTQVKLGLTDLKPIKEGYGMLLWDHAKKNKIKGYMLGKQHEVTF